VQVRNSAPAPPDFSHHPVTSVTSLILQDFIRNKSATLYAYKIVLRLDLQENRDREGSPHLTACGHSSPYDPYTDFVQHRQSQ
jgi:hypothetical protein